MPKAAYLIISGQVQGVGLRYSIDQYAKSKGLTGWVRNEPNGTVSCCLQNNEEEVKEFIDWLRNELPAKIGEIKEDWQEDLANYDNFFIKY
jgi:acylphosphatase